MIQIVDAAINRFRKRFLKLPAYTIDHIVPSLILKDEVSGFKFAFLGEKWESFEQTPFGPKMQIQLDQWCDMLRLE
jgi:hypothetical protein